MQNLDPTGRSLVQVAIDNVLRKASEKGDLTVVVCTQSERTIEATDMVLCIKGPTEILSAEKGTN